MDRKGLPMGRVWSHHFGSISTIRKNQLVFAGEKEGLEWIRQTLIEKGENQVLVLDLVALLRDTKENLKDSQQKIKRYTDKIRNFDLTDHSETFASFRGYEGSISKIYFQQVSLLLPEKYRFARRSQHPALDAFNCMLNYAYGMLYAACESALLKVGIDPHIGIMHRDEYNRPVLVYDFIEQFRHWADYVVIHLFLQEIIADDFFDIDKNQYWLNLTGKRILIQSFNDYLSELITLEGLSRSRLYHIEFKAQKLATLLKSFHH